MTPLKNQCSLAHGSSESRNNQNMVKQWGALIGFRYSVSDDVKKKIERILTELGEGFEPL